jgi:hypothetical protein
MRLRACLLSLVLALLLAGCGKGYKTAPVSGKVTLGGSPLPNAMVQFVPEGAGGKGPLPSSVGTTDKDGHYSLVLDNSSKTKGAVVGKHKVIITLGAGGAPTDTDSERKWHKQLHEKYSNYRKTELQCDVPATGREDANFSLEPS